MTASTAGLKGPHAAPISKFYHHVDQKMSWTDAQRYCREQFDDLATVDNLEELERLQESRKGSGYDTDTTWIGLHDDLTRWQWSDGNEDYRMGQHYGKWAFNEPNNLGSKQNCTVLIKYQRKWNDQDCNKLYSAVCLNGELDFLLNIICCVGSRIYLSPFPYNIKKTFL